jgi:hypothetical protein
MNYFWLSGKPKRVPLEADSPKALRFAIRSRADETSTERMPHVLNLRRPGDHAGSYVAAGPVAARD